MDALKDVLSFVGAIIGLLTALVPLCARFIDKKKSAANNRTASSDESFAESQEVVCCSSCGRRLRFSEELAGNRVKCPNCGQMVVLAPMLQLASRHVPLVELVDDEPEHYYEAQIDSKQVERARNLVKGPAIVLLVVGFLGLVFNLFVAGFGYVDEFITPLSSESKAKAAARGETGKKEEAGKSVTDRENERGQAIMTIVMLLSFAVASAMAVWAGFHMMKLRSYWLSMAGSFAIMPAGCFCCLAGFPVGIWSLVVLLKTEVSSSFS
jgi:predicted RNA-binding Zn-ribbon protein involved in translation (DUF1610 family)